MRSDRCEELALSGRPRVDYYYYEAGVHVVMRFSMHKQQNDCRKKHGLDLLGMEQGDGTAVPEIRPLRRQGFCG